MRFSSAALAASALFLTSSISSVVADEQCTCPSTSTSSSSSSDSNSGSSNDGSISGNWTPPSSYNPPSGAGAAGAPAAVASVKKVPKMKATKKTLEQGAQQAIQQLQNQNILPPAAASQVQAAVNSAIAKHAKPAVVAQITSSGTTSTITVTPTPTVVASTVTDDNGSVSTMWMTQTVTVLPPGATILPNATINALDDIQEAINDAIAAVNLSKTGLDASAQAELSTCLNAVMTNGGLPAGYSCISQSGSTSAGLKSTFNNVLEQFLGILPAKLIDDIQDAVMPMMTNLLPDEGTLLNNINSAIKSVVSSASGTSVTAIEMMQSCYSLAIKQNSNTSYLQCYMSNGGPYDALQSGMNGIIEQFVGVLPGELLDSVKNLTASTLTAGANDGLSSIGTNLTAQLDNALTSVTDSLTGNSVTLMEQLQQCANLLLQNGDATAAKNCVATKPAQIAETMVNSVVQQFSGYLPSSFFSDLASIISNMNSTGNFSQTQLITALDQANNNANMGPAFVGCFEQVQSCLTAEIAATGNIGSTCPGPVKGCELIGSNNSTGLANTTMDSMISAASASATATIIADNSTATDAATTAVVSSASSAAETDSAASTSLVPTSADASSSVAASDSSSSAGVASTDAIVAIYKATDASSSSAAAVETSSSEKKSEVASSSSSSSYSASAAATNGTESAAPSASATQKMIRKRSHQKLRMMYERHYAKL